MKTICKHAYPADLCGTCNPIEKMKTPETTKRFFIAQPRVTPKHEDARWVQWEIGDRKGQDRIALTSCKRKAELVRDALEKYHEK